MEALLRNLIGFIAAALLWIMFSIFVRTLSCKGGRHSLLPRYRALDKPHGRMFIWRSGRIGRNESSRGTITYVVSPNGLYIKEWLVGRILTLGAFPTLLIPWSDFYPLEQKDVTLKGPFSDKKINRFGNSGSCALAIGNPVITVLYPPEEIYKICEEYLSQRE